MKRIAILIVLCAGAAGAQMQQGKYVSVRLATSTDVYTGKTTAGSGQLHDETFTSHGSYHIYRLETPTMFYEISGNRTLEKDGAVMGGTIQFRVDKKHIYVLDSAGKERKYDIEGEGLK